MKQFVRFSFVTLLLACSLAAPSPPCAAEDGPVRQWLKERQAQRLQKAPAPVASADIHRPITDSGDYSFTLIHGGLTRAYRVHVPPGYNPESAVPLLFALHGGGGNMDYQANDAYYGLITQSDKEGFVAVFPNGYSKRKSGKFATWNAGNCCGNARDSDIDDVGFIRQIVGHLTSQMNIDRSRIYATGMSNGAMMAYRLACEMSDIFAAIASVAGTDNTQSCKPENPVAILHIHALNDSHVLFAGGAGPDSVARGKVTDFVSVPDTVSIWVERNGCPATPQRVLDKPDAYCELYSPCKGNADVQLCVTTSGGHSWPGGHKSRGDEPPSQAISANDVMWEFFNRH